MVEQQIKTLGVQWLQHGKFLRGWSKTTLRTYEQGLASLQVSLGAQCNAPQESPTISKASLEAWVIGLKEKGLTNGGINMYIRTINSFLSWLYTEGQLPSTLKLKLLPDPKKPLRGFSDNEIRSLLSFRPSGFTELRTWTLINFLLDTGCRIDELLTIKQGGVNLDELRAIVHGKGNKQRQVPLSSEFRKTLFRYIQVKTKQHRTTSEFLFDTKSGHKLSYRNTARDVSRLCIKIIGRHVNCHAFRHCFATTYIRRGGDIYRLSRILGHTSISTTQIYLRSMGIEQIGENHSSLSPLSRL